MKKLLSFLQFASWPGGWTFAILILGAGLAVNGTRDWTAGRSAGALTSISSEELGRMEQGQLQPGSLAVRSVEAMPVVREVEYTATDVLGSRKEAVNYVALLSNPIRRPWKVAVFAEETRFDHEMRKHFDDSKLPEWKGVLYASTLPDGVLAEFKKYGIEPAGPTYYVLKVDETPSDMTDFGRLCTGAGGVMMVTGFFMWFAGPLYRQWRSKSADTKVRSV